MTAYLSDWMPGQEAMDRIVEAADCAELEAWEAFRDAAADGALAVRMLGPIHGVTPVMRTVADLAEPHPVPMGYWQRAKQSGELIYLTDMHRYQVRRADVERLWPLDKAAPKRQREAYLTWLRPLVLKFHAEEFSPSDIARKVRKEDRSEAPLPGQERSVVNAVEKILIAHKRAQQKRD